MIRFGKDEMLKNKLPILRKKEEKDFELKYMLIVSEKWSNL